MKLAFYAPMKPPDHPVPSGDRTLARAILAALQHAGATVEIASALRSRDGVGDTAVQARLMQEAEAEVGRLIPLGAEAGWQAWITYHNYYKAPDLVGPAVARALDIPYLQIESTRARKRLTGPWACFARAAEAATDAARVVFYFSHRDAVSLREHAPKDQTLMHLPPFLPLGALPADGSHSGPMLSVGMMRAGDKLASYGVIAQTLALLPDTGWRLDIAGDGPARNEVAALMAPFGAAVRFTGECDPAQLDALYRSARLLFWPGVNEALGLIYLEAQARGLPVVAQDRPGMRDVLAPGPYPAPGDGPVALARMLRRHLDDPVHAGTRGAAARAHVETHHLMPAAARTLRSGLVQAGSVI